MSVTNADVPEVFFTDGWITAVEYVVSSGKEGTVYSCLAAPGTGRDRLAVKIYRPRTTRSFKNDAVYLSGRAMGVSLGGSKGLKSTGMPDRRLQRAVAKRSKRGIAAIESSWINHEYNNLQLLHAAGAHVPRPFAMSGQAVLMEYVGDANGPAPKLKEITLDRREAVAMFTALMAEIELWLACDRIHGDLSPFNILYWDGQWTVIDFPQAVNPWENPDSLFLLERDIRNLVTYFRDYGVAADPARIARELWRRFQWGTL